MEQQIAPVDLAGQSAENRAIPLCVDLDGTLVKSNTLVDSVLTLVRLRPADLLRVPGWIAQGRAQFKRHMAERVMLDVEHLPYNRELVSYLRQEHGAGRRIYLTTGADAMLADGVARFLGIFDGVMASDGQHNLVGGNKLAAFRQHFGEKFCYIGNAPPDAELLAACHDPMTANMEPSLRSKMRRAGVTPARMFQDRAPRLSTWMKAVRLHQWAKNALLFLPLLLAHAWRAATLAGAAIGFVSFGLCASATYIVNDLLDMEADRRHPKKRNRPFAAGDMAATTGIAAVGFLLAASVALAVLVPRAVVAVGGPALEHPFAFLAWVGIYAVTTLGYSLLLKQRMLVDVMVLSGLYTLRILAGSAATGVAVSVWLAGFSIFFFLSLAFVKRFSELQAMRERETSTMHGRGYRIGDIEQLRAFGTGTGCAAAVVMTLYINDPAARVLYRYPERLWLLVPVLLLWLFRVWMVASRGDMDEDPVVYAITNQRSLLLGAVMAGIVLLAR